MNSLHAFRRWFILSLAISGILVTAKVQTLSACSSFCMQDEDHVIFTKNYDWHLDHGLIIINKRNIAKRALLLNPNDKPAEWVSKYGSVTFNQYGREIPLGGINEAGLALETLMLPGSRYPQPDSRPALIAWIQYQLDNCSTIAEVINSDQKIRIQSLMPLPLHFMGCDRQGNAAIFEFINGKMVYHTGAELPIKAITNDTYKSSQAYLERHQGFGGTENIAHGSWGSPDRFVCAAERIKNYRPGSGVSIIDYAFDTLAAISQGDNTQWSIVYDLKNMQVHYKTAQCRQQRTINVLECDFDNETPVRMISINTPHTGLLNPHFYDYDPDINRCMIYYSFKKTDALKFLPEALVSLMAEYPEAPGSYYLLQWQVAGPYIQEDKKCRELFDIPFEPEESGTPVPWQDMPVNFMGTNPSYLDLQEVLKGGDHRAAYLKTLIDSESRKQFYLEIYSDDGVKAWLNGKIIHANNVRRGISSIADKVKVTLNEGSNHLMLKITQDTGPWGAIVRVEPVNNAVAGN
ncbi:MAG: linear amide C-N hydrolase [Sedimentisphaerales bacterium]|nr:linear amide C-N hydrolase [Sedimentisphaerales bacterium]